MGSEMCIRDRYNAGVKTGKTDNDDMVEDIVKRVEERAAAIKRERDLVEAAD